MDDTNRRGRYDNVPIPSYEEATITRPGPGQTHTGPSEVSDDAERQGLLSQRAAASTSSRQYQRPTIDSARSSIDSDLHLPEVAEEDEADAVRRDMEEMEMLDPQYPSSLRLSFSKRFSTLTHGLSVIRMPSFGLSSRFGSWQMPHIPWKPSVAVPIIARLIGLGLLALFIYALIRFKVLTRGSRMFQYDPESVRVAAQGEPDANRIAEFLDYISSFDHVAGTEGDLFLAKWMHDKWEAENLDEVETFEYQVYLNYPTLGGRRVSVVDPPEHRWDAALEEENVFAASGQARQQTLAWHGSSRSGNATGHLIYANGGSRDDFRRLAEWGINVQGSIVLVRHHATEHDAALKVKAAEMVGAAGCLIYTDPQADGFVKGSVIPDGPWRPHDSVQRDSVGLSSWVLGDYLTPGWPATDSTLR